MPTHLHTAPFERFDEWDGLPCHLLDLGAEAETGAMAPLRQLMVAGTKRAFASQDEPGSSPLFAAPTASAANAVPP